MKKKREVEDLLDRRFHLTSLHQELVLKIKGSLDRIKELTAVNARLCAISQTIEYQKARHEHREYARNPYVDPHSNHALRDENASHPAQEAI